MKIGIFYMDRLEATYHDHMAPLLINSIRRTMPNVRIVHLADMATGQLLGTDDVLRIDIAQKDYLIGRLQAQANAQHEGEEWLFLDTDTIVQQDVRDVWETPFDIAVARRHPQSPLSSDIGQVMPYNSGVVFSRSPAFWQLAWRFQTSMGSARTRFGDQLGINFAIRHGTDFQVAILPPTYNYTPRHPYEDVSDKAILHYKGDAKSWILGGRRWNVISDWVKEKGWTRGAEIGIKRGRMFTHTLHFCPTLTLYGVDIFEPRPGLELDGGESNTEMNFPKEEARLRAVCAQEFPGRGHLIKGYSVEVAKTFPDGHFDYVFIDADHREQAVRDDIAAWLPKVRPGGTLCGHDYQAKFPGVIKAVDDLLPDRRLHADSVWEWPVP